MEQANINKGMYICIVMVVMFFTCSKDTLFDPSGHALLYPFAFVSLALPSALSLSDTAGLATIDTVPKGVPVYFIGLVSNTQFKINKSWVFSDGQREDTSSIAIRAFSQPGVYHAYYSIQDEEGDTLSDSVTVRVVTVPVVDSLYIPLNGDTDVGPSAIKFAWHKVPADPGDTVLSFLLLGVSRLSLDTVGRNIRGESYLLTNSLLPSTKYYWRVILKSSFGRIDSSVVDSFTTGIQQYTLTTSATNGSIALSPSGGTYNSGTVVTVTATPAAGYAFSGWSGDLSGTTNPTPLTMNGNKSVTAMFKAIPQYTLTTSATNGSIALSPSGGTYNSGTVVTVTAMPAAGYTFSGWSGDLSVTKNPTTITMNGNKSVTATFKAVPQYTLTTSATNGSIALSPSGGTYNSGTVVTVIAMPAAGYTFSGWSGDLTVTMNPTTITMNGNKSVTAMFKAIPQYTLTTSATNGSISLIPSGGTYNSGMVVTVIAMPAAGYTFSGWSGDLTVTMNPTTITMNGNKSVTATFTAISQYTLTTSATNGTISLIPSGGTYNSGMVVTVMAMPAAGYTFGGWSGDLTVTTNPTTITMNGNKNITANFTLVPVITTYEAENLTRTASSVDSNVSTGDTNNSNGAYVQLSGTPAVGAWIEFTLPSLTAGTYDIKMYFKANTNRGICQGSVDGTNMGMACDEYRSAVAYQVMFDMGSRVLTGGNHALQFTVIGKNAASAGYTMTIDKIVLTPQ